MSAPDLAIIYYVLIGAVALGATWAIARLAMGFRGYLRLRGQRLVTCPETNETAAVRLAAAKAGLQATVHAPDLRLSQCSRWPERLGCGQECLGQIEDAPEECLVSTIVNDWYAGKSCIYCQKPFGEIHWHDHPPALMNKEKKTVEWNDISPEKLPEVLATHSPVCWSCHIAETFRKEHPELVVDRRTDPRRLTIYH